MKFETDPALALVAAKGIDATVLTAVVQGSAFVEFCSRQDNLIWFELLSLFSLT